MNPWQILNIEPTDDRKAIKKAYAGLLRQHRPDTDPEGFQRINEAYQAALKWGEVGLDDMTPVLRPPTADESERATEPATVKHNQDSPPSADSATSHSDQAEPEVAVDDAAWHMVDDILKQFKATAFAPITVKQDLSNWRFLEQFHDISDLAAREALSEEVFKRIAEYNHFQLQAGNLPAFDAHVVNYCSEVLDWEANWVRFERRFPPAYVQHVYHKIEWHQGNGRDQAPATWWQRTLALWFDVVVALAASLLVGALWFSDQAVSVLFVGDYRLITGLLFVLLTSGLQLSRWRKSPGQHINDIKVYDLFGNHPPIQMMWVRVAVFHASMSPLYVFYLWPEGPFWMKASFAYLVGMINLFMRLKKHQWLHEWVSGTVAIK